MIAKLFTLRGVCFLFILVVGGASLLTTAIKARHEATYITQHEVAYIEQNLSARNVSNCVLEPIEGGWKCTTHDGKVYKVHR